MQGMLIGSSLLYLVQEQRVVQRVLASRDTMAIPGKGFRKLPVGPVFIENRPHGGVTVALVDVCAASHILAETK